MKRIARLDSRIIKLTIPIFIELGLQFLVGSADQVMVGWRDPNGVGAIANANQITSLILLVFSMVCTASTILVSQYLGAQDPRKLSQIYTVSLITNLAFGLVISLFLAACAGPIFTFMGVKEEFFDQAAAYLRIVGGCMVFQSVFLTFAAFFRAHQMMVENMAVSVTVNILNLLGNAVLINGLFGLPAMGVVGAAISSVVSRFIGVVLIALLFRRKMGKAVTLKVVRPFPWQVLKRLLAIGVPSGGEAVSYNLSQVAVQCICNAYAVYMVNTRAYANMFAMVTYLFAAALSQAAQVLVANLMGAGDLEETDRRVRSTVFFTCLVSSALSITMFLFARPIYSLFTTDPQILALCPLIMLAEIPLELGRAVNITMVRCLTACGDIRFPITVGICSAWTLSVGGGWLLGTHLGLGLVGVWVVMAMDECLRATLFLIRWKRGKWRQKKLI